MGDTMIKNFIKRLTLLDGLLIILIIIFAAFLQYRLANSQDNKSAYIYLHNTLFGVYDLSKPQTVKVGENCVAEIKNGKIRMIKSTCPDKRCVKQNWSNQLPIVCLPNEVVIEIKSVNSKQKIHHLY
jgi:hypothetical protein